MKLQILSLGLGWQSTALYFMSALGEIPRIDAAIFADPGGEKRETYEYLKYLLRWAEDHQGPPIIVCNSKSLEKDLLTQMNFTGQRFASIPAYTHNEDGSEGMMRRQCTSEYKIDVVDKAIRNLYCLKAHQRNVPTLIWKGISLDEISRIDKPKDKWKTFVYPLCGFQIPSVGKAVMLNWGQRMSRHQLPAWYREHNLMMPPKSSCKFCPFMSDFNWMDMKLNHPEDFADAVAVDHAIRDSSQKGATSPLYLHRSMKPLDEVVFDATQTIDFGECSGNCHT